MFSLFPQFTPGVEVLEPSSIKNEPHAAAPASVMQPMSIPAGQSPIRQGATFASFAEFEAAFEQWKLANCHPLRTSSSEILRQPDGTVDETFKYRYIVFQCAHYGWPRAKGLGKRTYNAYLPCGCKAQLRLNFSYSDKALRITTLNDVHTGHETSRDSYAEVSAKCRRRSSVANPAPSRQLSGVSGANAWSPSVSVYNLQDENRRSFLMGQHSFPSPFPSVGHQGLFGLQQRRSSSNGNPTEHSEVLQSGSSATASAAPKRPQHFTISSILGDDAGNDGLAATPPAITDDRSPLELLADIVSAQSHATVCDAHGKPTLNDVVETQSSDDGQDGNEVTEMGSQVADVLAYQKEELPSQTLSSGCIGDSGIDESINPEDLRGLLLQTDKIFLAGASHQVLNYFKYLVQKFMLTEFVKRAGSTDMFLAPEFKAFAQSIDPNFELPGIDELQRMIFKEEH